MSQELTLRTPFKPSEVRLLEHKKDRDGNPLPYVSIDATINRLLDCLPGYSFRIVEFKHQYLESGNWAVAVHGRLELPSGEVHDGLGGKTGKDLDDTLKTALAEAIKKAGHQLGIGLELWTEEGRSMVRTGHAAAQAVVSGDLASLKNHVFKLAKKYDAGTTPADIAKFFKIKVDELQDAAVLTKILKEHKVID